MVYPSNWTISGYRVWGDGISKLLTNVTIAGGALLGHGRNGVTGMGDFYRLNLSLAGDLTVQSNGQINADFCGYKNASGPAGSTNTRDGGGYGGKGGDFNHNGVGLPPYGSILTPTNTGSGGGDPSFGGGAIAINVAGTTTVTAGGLITAQGDAVPNYGAGAGGSIYLTTAGLFGGGTIRANGGAISAGGGGGRVSLVLTGPTNDFATFTGLVSAYGGIGGSAAQAWDGSAGTIYEQTAADGAARGLVVVDNAGRTVWTSTVWTGIPATTNATEPLIGTRWLARSNGNIRLLANTRVQSLTMTAGSALELAGKTLRVNALTVTNTNFRPGIYTTNDTPLFTDSVGGGQVFIYDAPGTVFEMQ